MYIYVAYIYLYIYLFTDGFFLIERKICSIRIESGKEKEMLVSAISLSRHFSPWWS